MARIECALGTKTNDYIWLALLARNRSKFRPTSLELAHTEGEKWRVSRNVRLRKIQLSGHMQKGICTRQSDGKTTGESILTKCIEKICQHITTLELRSIVLKDFFWKIVPVCPNLTNLKIVGTPVELNTNFTHLPLSHITSLYIDMHYFKPTDLVAFLQLFPELTHLHISGNFYDKYLELTELCPHLTHLCLRDSCIAANHFVTLMETLKQGLHCLALPDCHRFYPKVLDQLSRHSITLRCLHMTGKFDMLSSAPKVAQALNECKSLVTLYLHGSVVASGDLRMPSVTTLHIEYCTQPALDHLQTSFPSITALGILSTPMSDAKFLASLDHCLTFSPQVGVAYVVQDLCEAFWAILLHRAVFVQTIVEFDVSCCDDNC